MVSVDIQDRLAVVGVVVGIFVILVGVGTLLGAPWNTTASTGAALVQVVGILATVLLGALIILVSYTEEPSSYLPE